MYIVREGNKRGRGAYLTRSQAGASASYFYHYTRRQRRARRFATPEQAWEGAKNVWHVTSCRIVKLTKKVKQDY